MLVTGLVAVHPELTHSLPFASKINPYVRLALVIAAAYIAGWIVYALTLIITGLVTGLLNVVFGKRQFVPNNLHFSQGTTWQKVARQFLGPDLAPPIPPAPTPAQVSPEKVGEIFKQNFHSTLKSNNEWK